MCPKFCSELEPPFLDISNFVPVVIHALAYAGERRNLYGWDDNYLNNSLVKSADQNLLKFKNYKQE